MSNNFCARNHYVPQFYLRNWAHSNKVFVYNNLVSHIKVPTFQHKVISGIAYVDHLYTTLRDKQEYDDFEKWINNEVETPYIRAQDRVLRNASLKQQDYDHIVRFAMAQFCRVPYYYIGRYTDTVDSLEPLIQESLEETSRKITTMVRNGIPINPSQIKLSEPDIPISIHHVTIDGVPHIKATVLAGRQAWLRTTMRMVGNVLSHTKDHMWQIIPALRGDSWYTSDNPVTVLNYHSETEYNFQGGWIQNNIAIFMPISPQYLLFTQVGCYTPVKNTIFFQNLINRFIVENSFLQVYRAY